MKKFILAALFLVPSLSFAAVTSSFQRISHSNTTPLTIEVVTATLSGTYATGGFTWNPTSIAAGPGSSPLVQKNVRAINWISPNGYMYATTVTAGVATTKIFSAAGTELTNGAAVPDATATVIIYLGL